MHFVEAKGILSAKNGMNVYRGCTHGCIYCDSRSTCYGMEHAFEDIEVKRNAPILLEQALRSKRKKCMIATGAMCDPYLHAEETLRITRSCLQVIERYEFGASVLTKSDRVLQDLELIERIHHKAKFVLQMTLTTYDDALCKVIEPNVCPTSRRIEVLEIFQKRNIPTMVWLCPLLPFINDTEENVKYILDACIRTGVKGIINFGMGLTLRDGDREYYYQALDRHFPGLKRRYIEQYGNQYEIPSPNGKKLMRLFTETCKKNGLLYRPEDCFAYLNELPEKYEQLSLFDF